MLEYFPVSVRFDPRIQSRSLIEQEQVSNMAAPNHSQETFKYMEGLNKVTYSHDRDHIVVPKTVTNT